jgi:hypothetical protein
MKTLLKRLQNAVSRVFEPREQMPSAVLAELHEMGLGLGDRDTWIANAYLDRQRREADYAGWRRW